MYELLIIFIILLIFLIYKLHHRRHIMPNSAYPQKGMMARLDTGNFITAPDQKYIYVTNIELQRDPMYYDNRKIILDGQYVSGPDASILNDNIWVKFTPNIQIINGFVDFQQGMLKAPVRVYGTIMYKVPFGHNIGLYNFIMVADRIEYYDTQMPDTRIYSGPFKTDPTRPYYYQTPVEVDPTPCKQVEHYDPSIHLPHTPHDPTFADNPNFNPAY